MKKDMVKVSIDGLMELTIKVNLLMIKNMVKDF